VCPCAAERHSISGISAVDLVPQRVEPTSRISLGRPVQRMLQGSDRVCRAHRPHRPHRLLTGLHRGGTSHIGTHRTPRQQRCASTKQRPFPHRRLCCPPGSPVLRPPPTPTRHATHFPRSSVIGRDAPTTPPQGHRAEEGLPSSRRHLLNVPRPHTPGSPSRLRSKALHRFHGLHPDFEGLGTPCIRPQGRTSNDAAGFA
jgi:hypothetical protein